MKMWFEIFLYRVRAVPEGYREDFPNREGDSRTGRLPVKPGGLTPMRSISYISSTFTHICCDGKVLQKGNGTTCCYQTPKGCGTVTMKGKIAVYNPNTHTCCDGKLRKKKIDSNTVSCCGQKPYNTKTHLCCGQNVYTLNHSPRKIYIAHLHIKRIQFCLFVFL